MGVHSGPNIVRSNLTVSLDSRNRKSFLGDNFYNLTNLQNLGNPSWSNGASELTVILIIKILGSNTEYAYHPVNKWNSGTNDASFVFYHFQNYLGTNPQNENLLGWYANAGGTWQGISGQYKASQNTSYFVALQYNSQSGGQLWINNSKVGSRTGSGVLGSGSSDILIDGNVTGRSNIHKVEMLKFYNKDLPDSQILSMYDLFKNRL